MEFRHYNFFRKRPGSIESPEVLATLIASTDRRDPRPEILARDL